MIPGEYLLESAPIELNVGRRVATIEVANRGEPIPAAHLGEVFRPFWRRSGPRGRDGLGLGLHICDQIAKAHGGRIDVTSTSGDGTRFIASLPIVEVGAASN